MGYSLSELGAGSSRGYVDFAEKPGADTDAMISPTFNQAPLG